ncbi:MAG: low molecular weight protein-tyrosine-phosphatase [Sciscionella sp.]
MTLPAPRATGRPYRIALVCLGNICRSPMAEVVLTAALHDAGIVEGVEASSGGTGDWHLGQPMDPRAAKALLDAGYDASRHRARHVDADWLAAHDVVLVMDEANLSDVTDLLAGDPASARRVILYRTFDPAVAGAPALPDPWYGGEREFAATLQVIEQTTPALVDELRDLLGGASRP